MSIYSSKRKPKATRGRRARAAAGSEGSRPDSARQQGGSQLGAFYATGPAVPLVAPVQTKVTVGRPGDRYEREADAVAERVTGGQKAPPISSLPPGGLASVTQRREEGTRKEAEEERVQKQEEGKEKKPEESVRRQEEEEEEAQPKAIQRQEETEEEEAAQAQVIQCQEEEEEEEAQPKALQRQEAEEEEAQPKAIQRQKKAEEKETAQKQTLQRQEEPEEKEAAQTQAVQRQAEGEEEEEEEEVQPKPIQRQEEGEEEEEVAQTKKTEEEEPEAQRRAASGPVPGRGMERAAGRAIRNPGPGEALRPDTRRHLESGLGVDLSEVRVHEDNRSKETTAALNARAFTHKNHIWLGRGESQHDVGLMAHEATHAVQQGGLVRRKPAEKAEDKEAGGVNARGEGKPGAFPTTAAGPSAAAPATAPGPARTKPAGPKPAVSSPAAQAQKPSREVPSTAETGASAQEPVAASETASEAPGAVEGAKTEEATAAGEGEGAEQPPGAAGPGAGGAPPPVTSGAATPAAAEGAGVAAEGKEGASKKEEGKEKEKGTAQKKGAEVKQAAAPSPAGDPRFQGVMKRLGAAASQAKTHEPAAKKVSDARSAAEPPANDQSSRAQADQVDTMARQKPKRPEKDDFLSMLRAELERIAPKNMEETEEFKKKGKAGQLKEALTGKVDAQKEDSAKDIKGAAAAEPDPESVEAKEVVPMPEEPADPPAPDLRVKDVLPVPKPEEEISAQAHKDQAEQLMAENDLDEEQLQKANEPQFTEALDAKTELEEHADQVPEAYREEEQSYLTEAETDVEAKEAAAKDEFRARRAKAKSDVGAKQSEAKKKEEEERKKVADEIQGMYEATKKKVEEKLSALDGEVNRLFDDGEKQARDRFESEVDRKMSDYKWNRYISRIGGSLLWAKDKLFGMPDEVNRFYEEGRDQYIEDMDAVLVKIADTVETRLKEAKDEIAKGKEKIREFVDGLPKSLQKAGEEAEAKVSEQFSELERGVENKKQELARQMAKRYQEAREKLDARIEELKAQNQGLLDGFIVKIKEIIEILRKFKNQVMGLLQAGADTIRQIVKDPVGFLKNLLAAVKKGFTQFKDRIFDHLKKGLVNWLFGTMAKAGIEIPSSFSVKAIFGLVLQVLGITRERIRAKLVKLIGAKNVGRIEKAWEIVSTLITEGPAGLWKRVKAFFGNLKEMVLGAVREWLITQVVKQAVLWLISLFNPAAALLKAIKLIYDVIMFFVENIQRIMELVKAVIESVSKIVAGNIAAAANWVEAAMGRTVPVIIGFLARLLGLSGISDKIRGVIQKIQKKVSDAIDRVLKKIVKGIKKLLGKGKAATKRAAEAIKGFIFPRQTFRAGEESHTIFFEGKGAAAKVMVASRRPQTLTNLVNALASKPENKNKQGTVKSIRAHLSVLTRFQNELKRAKDRKAQGKIRAKISGKIKDIAGPMADLMEAETFGTRKSPLPLDWPKPASSAYPRLYLGPKSGKRIPQVTLKGAAAGNQSKIRAVINKLTAREKKEWVKNNHKIVEYTPEGKEALPGGEASIGVEDPWTLSSGKEFQLEAPKSTTGGHLINDRLMPYGFRPGAEKKDGDHIVEMQLGGENKIENLWPLDSKTNRASGGILSRKVFDVKGTKIPMSVVKARASKGTEVWVKISSTK